MSSKLKDVWARESRFYTQGFECEFTRKGPLAVYGNKTRQGQPVAKIVAGTKVKVYPIKGSSMPAVIEVEVNNKGDMKWTKGWISLGGFGVKMSVRLKAGFSMKPQDFDMPLDKAVGFNEYVEKVKGAIRARKGIPDFLKDYMVQLVEYCANHDNHNELKESYEKLMASDYSNSIDSLEKDFSEIMAPLCVIERGQRELHEMGYTGITRQSVKVYVPKKGNEPLLDFKLVGKDIEYPFSVKKASGVTNTIKPKHIMALFNAKTTKKHKDSIEYEVLKILAEHPKPNIINGPFYGFKHLYNKFGGRLGIVLKEIDKMIPDNGVPVVEEYQEEWTKVINRYYNTGMQYWDDGKFKNGNHGLCSLTCQMALEKISKEFLDYKKIMIDVVMSQVNFYKFSLNKGNPKFFMENDLYNKVKPDQKFYLRNKSDKSRPDRESVGVQP